MAGDGLLTTDLLQIDSQNLLFQQVVINFFSFVETARKFIIAELSIRKLGSSSVLIILMKIRAYGSKALQWYIYVVFPES